MNETIEAIRVLGFWRVVFLRVLYRPLSRWMHRHHLHYAPPSYPQREDGYADKMLWCQWCGMRYVVPRGQFPTDAPK